MYTAVVIVMLLGLMVVTMAIMIRRIRHPELQEVDVQHEEEEEERKRHLFYGDNYYVIPKNGSLDRIQPVVSFDIKLGIDSGDQTLFTITALNNESFVVSATRMSALFTKNAMSSNRVKNGVVKRVVNKRLTDGEWHNFKFEIAGMTASVTIDDAKQEIPVSGFVVSSMKIGGFGSNPIYVGGEVKNIVINNNPLQDDQLVSSPYIPEYVFSDTYPVYSPIDMSGFDTTSPEISMDLKITQGDNTKLLSILSIGATTSLEPANRNLVSLALQGNELKYVYSIYENSTFVARSAVIGTISTIANINSWHTIKLKIDAPNKRIKTVIDTSPEIISEIQSFRSDLPFANIVFFGAKAYGIRGTIKNVVFGSNTNKILTFTPLEYVLGEKGGSLEYVPTPLDDFNNYHQRISMNLNISSFVGSKTIMTIGEQPTDRSENRNVFRFLINDLKILRYERITYEPEVDEPQRSFNAITLGDGFTFNNWHKFSIEINSGNKFLKVMFDDQDTGITQDENMPNYYVSPFVMIGNSTNGILGKIKDFRIDESLKALVPYVKPAPVEHIANQHIYRPLSLYGFEPRNPTLAMDIKLNGDNKTILALGTNTPDPKSEILFSAVAGSLEYSRKSTGEKPSAPQLVPLPQLADGNWHSLKFNVNVDGKRASVRYDNQEQPILYNDAQMPNMPIGTSVYVGGYPGNPNKFTGSVRKFRIADADTDEPLVEVK